ncbi:hypothetical protein F2P79_009398 [Pimephales promelas]|nr:hypothetical protein F2P79_009398 [Pimephales promelas]
MTGLPDRMLAEVKLIAYSVNRTLFTEAQIKEEFRRITTYSLEETFTRKLDEYSRGLLRLMRAKGEVAGCKMCPLLDTLNDTQNIEKHEMLLSAASLKTRLPW